MSTMPKHGKPSKSGEALMELYSIRPKAVHLPAKLKSLYQASFTTVVHNFPLPERIGHLYFSIFFSKISMNISPPHGWS